MDSDPVDELCTLLSSFHISQRLAEIISYQETECDIDSAWKSLLSISSRVFSPGLPRPHPGRQPCWEPQHSFPRRFWHLEALIDVQKELAKRDGNKEVAWRTDFMVEIELLRLYGNWVCDGSEDAEKVAGNKDETALYRGLKKNIQEVFVEVAYHDPVEIVKGHGRSGMRIKSGQ